MTSIKVDVRIITATNKDLEAEVKSGRFRDDLYYRLNVVPIHLPALRERRDDIDLLVKFFIAQFNDKLKKGIQSVAPDAMNMLRNYSWPGNIRQLENALERMILMCEARSSRPATFPRKSAGVRSHAAVRGARALESEGNREKADPVPGAGSDRARARGDCRKRHPRGGKARTFAQRPAAQDEGTRNPAHRRLRF